MKRWCVIMLVLCTSLVEVSAQSYEVQQLLLNVEKLAQFKQILSDLKKGYDILSKGYGVIRDISEGNFSLHKTFLDALFEVSPTVRKYKKIAGIMDLQIKLTRQYKSAFSRFKSSGQFTADEINYLSRVYGRLFDESLQNLDDLSMVITAGKLRMSDDERLAAIDRIYAEMENKLAFLHSFNGKTSVLAVQLAKESSDAKIMRELYNK
jgi:hypothetical protein